jgi:hypothetical protein
MAELLGITGNAAQQVYSNIENGTTKRIDPDVIKRFNALISNEVMEEPAGYGSKQYTMQDLVDSMRKTEAVTHVMLSAVAEVLARVSDRSASVVISELEEAVRKRLKVA